MKGSGLQSLDAVRDWRQCRIGMVACVRGARMPCTAVGVRCRVSRSALFVQPFRTSAFGELLTVAFKVSQHVFGLRRHTGRDGEGAQVQVQGGVPAR